MINNFGVYKIFVELFIFGSDSSVYSPTVSQSEGLERSKLFNYGPLANGYEKSPIVNFFTNYSFKGQAYKTTQNCKKRFRCGEYTQDPPVVIHWGVLTSR
jgi:hypothetical protein